jgi:hypothetical protein
VALLQRTHPLAALVEEAEKCHKSVLIAQHFQINKTASSPSEISQFPGRTQCSKLSQKKISR